MITTTLDHVVSTDALPGAGDRAAPPPGAWHRVVRRWDDLPLRAKGLFVIAIPLIPLFAAAALFSFGARNARRANDWMTHTLEAKVQIATVLSLMVDAETGVRGFLLTRDSEALRPYENATANLPGAVAGLSQLVADNAIQVEHLRRLSALMTARPLSRLLVYARDHPGEAPPMQLFSDSRTTMEALRQELAAMQLVEDRLLAQRSQVTRVRLVQLSIAGAAFGLVGGALAVLAFSSGVVRRIDRVRENAARLACGSEMLPVDEARDEVGQLARGLHDASRLLQVARSELDQFFSLSLDLMGIAGTDGRFRRVNAAWQRTLGWTMEELTSAPYLDFVHPDDRDATAAEAARLAEGGMTVSFENRYRCKDGSYRWLNWTTVAAPERGLLYAAARDVTEQKQAAVALRQHAAELGALNAELEAFSYSVSHDLRAPLRHVTGFASMLEKSAGVRFTEQDTRYLRTIVDAASRMGRLIDDLLAFSRMGRSSLERRRISLDAVVRDALHEVQGASNNETVAWTIHPLPDVEADATMLRLVFVNLLSNAVKYSGGRPHPTVEVGVETHAPGETVVYVRDNGVGFDMTYAHKLFGVFQRLHSSDEFEGTGIGLANVRRIIGRHGGRAWATGAVDGGATFYISLPTGVFA